MRQDVMVSGIEGKVVVVKQHKRQRGKKGSIGKVR